MQNKILIVDDETDIVDMLKEFFELTNYLVYTAFNGSEALEKIALNPDIILLDINMPDIDGIEVCKKIREHITSPILFLTARIEENDRILGFTSGGDDYILKPFQIGELGARVAAHLRREQRNNLTHTIKFWDIFTINYSTRTLLIDNEIVSLTKKEFEIIELLTLHEGQIFTKEHIYEKVWGFDANGDSSVIIEHIRRIRQKFSKYTNKEIINTVWGVGYQWTLNIK